MLSLIWNKLRELADYDISSVFTQQTSLTRNEEDDNIVFIVFFIL